MSPVREKVMRYIYVLQSKKVVDYLVSFIIECV